jgi:hypothetical protein
MEQLASVADVDVAHLALDAARVEPATTAHASAGGNFLEHRVAPLR